MSCNPPMKVMMQASDGQPVTGSPNSAARTAMKHAAKNATTHNTMPTYEAKINGAVEQETDLQRHNGQA